MFVSGSVSYLPMMKFLESVFKSSPSWANLLFPDQKVGSSGAKFPQFVLRNWQKHWTEKFEGRGKMLKSTQAKAIVYLGRNLHLPTVVFNYLVWDILWSHISERKAEPEPVHLFWQLQLRAKVIGQVKYEEVLLGCPKSLDLTHVF